MACACNKPKRPVANSAAKAAAITTKSPAQKTREAQAAKRASGYSLIMPSGRVQRFGSRLEADAANAREGRRGKVRPD